MSYIRLNLLIIITAIFCLHQVSKSNGYDDEKYNTKYYYGKADAVGTKFRNIPDSISKGKAIINKFGKIKGEVESPITFKKGMYKAAEFDNGKTDSLPPKKPVIIPKLPAKVIPAKRNETEAEKAERVHRTFEKLLTFVEIVGQVDNYVSTKWKNLVRTVSNLYEEENEDEYRVHGKKLQGCPLLKETN